MKITLWKSRLRDTNIFGRILWAIMFPILAVIIYLIIVLITLPILFIMWVMLIIGIFFPGIDNG